MRGLYFDCFSGASGDMILGALLDAGADESAVRTALDALQLKSWNLTIEPTSRGSLRATKATVAADDDTDRDYQAVVALIERCSLEGRVANLALATFKTLGEAEARVHSLPIDRVHLHEVGSLDAIIDVVGACAAFVSLGVERTLCSPLVTGRGLATTAHGTIPVPAPAVTEILAARGAPVVGGGEGELLTPTGAALLATLVDEFAELPALQLETVGYGAGSAEREVPNVLRALVGELAGTAGDLLLIETNIDDMSPELLPHVVDKTLAAGAVDAWLTPIVMKKGRPAHTLSVLTSDAKRESVLEVIFAETTTLGVRSTRVGREVLEREWVTTEVGGQPVRVKLGRRHGRLTTVAPEYEDAAHAAATTGMPLKDIYARATESARATGASKRR